jgi:hypothetical protein
VIGGTGSCRIFCGGGAKVGGGTTEAWGRGSGRIGNGRVYRRVEEDEMEALEFESSEDPEEKEDSDDTDASDLWDEDDASEI